MPQPLGAHSDSASSYSSSKSSLLALPLDDISSQSDVADAFPHAMPRNDAVYGVAASPTHPTSVANVSATQKLKRAFGKRRRPTHDAGSFLSSGDERSSPGSSQRPSAAKITMHLFGARKHPQPPDPNRPPPLPPKEPSLRTPHPSNPQHPANSSAAFNTTLVSRPRTSVMVSSPSITAAIEFMREDEERERAAEHLRERERTALESHREMEENKENWRKSDSTMDSGHTVRPATAPADPASKRVSAFLATSPSSGTMDLLEFLAGAPEPDRQWQDSRPSDVSPSRQSKRRSRSLNITVPSSLSSPSPLSAASVPSFAHSPPYPSHPASTDLVATDDMISSSGHTVGINTPLRETPVIIRTPANGIITSGSPVSKSNIRGRLAAWTGTTGTMQPSPSPSPLSTTAASTSTPSLTTPSMTSMHQAPHHRVIVTSDASPPSSSDMQAIAAVREMQNRVRSPSASSTSSSAGIRQAATSLTSGAGAMALGLGKRAYEKVGRVWGSSQSGSGSGSDTPSHRQPSPVNAYPSQPHPFHNPSHGPSAFPPHNRRTPGTSGTWSVSSMGGSRSSSEKDRSVSNPESSGSSMSNGLGRLVRPPRSNTGGVVFGRQLWVCVKDTKATVLGPAREPLGARMIPALVYRCAQHIHKWGLEEEGLFRISGRSSHISRLRNEFDGGADYDITECSPSELDPHAVASVFKAYLRELPEPILTRALGPSFDAAVSAEGSHGAPPSASGLISKSIVGGGPTLPSGPRALPSLRKPPSLSTFTLPTSSSLRAPSSTLIEALGDLISRLPPENRDVLQTVVELMNATAARSAETKMPLSNLLLVFCPSLSMPPTLLRTLCDVQAIWEPRPPVVVNISRKSGEGESEVGGGDNDGSVEDSDSGLEDDGDIVLLPSRDAKGKQKDVVGTSASIAEAKSGSMAETVGVEAEEVVSSAGSARSRAIQRMPVPTLFLDSQQLEDSRAYMAKSHNLPVLTDPPPRLESIPSRDSPSRGRTTPSVSPMRSEVSLNSILADKRDAAPPSTQLYPSSNSVSSVLITYAPPNHNKDLPASPRTPISPIGEPRKTQEEPRPDTTQTANAQRSEESLNQTADTQRSKEYLEQTADAHRSEESVNTLDSSATSQPRRPEAKQHPQASLSPLGKEGQSGSAPELRAIVDTSSERSLSLPTPLVPSSPSTPNVAFPSIPKTTPSTPTSLKKHTLTMSLGRTLKMSADDTSDPPSPSRRLARRPSLNMLLNLTRSGSPSPRARTPTISSPLASPAVTDREGGKEMSPGVVPNLFPPVLTLPIEGGMDVGLGWDDMFGKEEATSVTALQRRDTVMPRRPATQPSSPSYEANAGSSAASSGGLLGFSGPPSELPSATAVLQTASSSPIKPSSASSPPSSSSSSAASSPVVFQEDTLSGEDRSMVEFPRVSIPVEEEQRLSPAPHLNFQLRGTSLEEEDWASIVLLAAGKPAESIA